MDIFLKDVFHAVRSLKNSPGFTLAALAALAVGIGANAAIFSVINAVLLTPMSVPEADRMVWFGARAEEGTNRAGSPAKFQHWLSQTDIVEDVAAMRPGVVNYTGGDLPEQLASSQASLNYFRLFRAPIILGRSFTPEEDRPNGPRVAVIGEPLWERRFDRDPDIVGQTIALSGDTHTVVGVVGADFDLGDFGRRPQVWTPFQLDPNSDAQGHYFQVMGRLKDGVTLAQANAALEQSTQAYRARFPDVMNEAVFDAIPVHEQLVRNSRSSLLTLMGAVGFVLLIACANVANLLLVRASGRKREMALRAALGAGRGRLIRQLLTESVVLSALGGALGLALGLAGIRALLTVNTAGLARIGEDGALVGLDWRVATFTVAVTFVTGLLFGLLPALRSSRADLNSTLKESSSRSGSGLGQNKLRSLLVVTEVALALVLLVGSALFLRTWGELQAVDPGWDPTNVVSVRMSLTGERLATSAGVADLVRNGTERLRTLAGVEAASATCCVPLETGFGLPFTIVGRPLEDQPFHGGGGWATVSPGFFDVFQIPLRRGRVFTDADRGGAPAVVVINETMADRLWADADPLGERLIIGRGIMPEFADEPEREIIGIVADTLDGQLTADDVNPKMYIPQAQQTDAVNALNSSIGPMAWVVRTAASPLALVPAVEEELRQVSGLPVADARTMDETILRSTSRQRFQMWLMTVFAGTALLLAAIGVYGLMAYSVEQRTQEIGIRLALGAEVGQVRGMVVRQGMLLVAVGVIIGLASAGGLARVIASLLFGVEAWDTAAFTTVPALLATVALVAVLVPARRASQIDPVDALRYE